MSKPKNIDSILAVVKKEILELNDFLLQENKSLREECERLKSSGFLSGVGPGIIYQLTQDELKRRLADDPSIKEMKPWDYSGHVFKLKREIEQTIINEKYSSGAESKETNEPR